MSQRVVDSGFNLRSLLQEKLDSHHSHSLPVTLSKASTVSSVASVQQQPALKFDFSSLKNTSSVSVASTSAPPLLQDAMASFRLNMPVARQFASSPVNKSGLSEVMRLSAVVDDLSARLKKANDRATLANAQVHQAQAAMLAERSAATDKLNAAHAQLNASRSNEMKLKAEAGRLANAPPSKSPDFSSAVSAAIATEDARSKLIQEKERYKSMLQESEDAVASLKKHMELEKAEEMNKQRLAVQKGEETVESLKANLALTEAVNVELLKKNECLEIKCCKSCDENMRLTTEASGMASRMSELSNMHSKALEELASAKGDVEVAQCERQAALEELSIAQAAEESNKAEALAAEHVENAAVSATPQAPKTLTPRGVDPVKMHEKYEKLRSSIALLSKRIMKLELEDDSKECAIKLKIKRDDLYMAAVNLKRRYDTMFGAIEPVSVVQVSGDESFFEESIVVSQQDPCAQRCRSQGSPPDSSETYKVSFARDMASQCVLGSAEAISDCCIGIAMYTVCNDQLGAEVSAPDEQTPTEGRDASEEMVNAIVQDLTAFLKAE